MAQLFKDLKFGDVYLSGHRCVGVNANWKRRWRALSMLELRRCVNPCHLQIWRDCFRVMKDVSDLLNRTTNEKSI